MAPRLSCTVKARPRGWGQSWFRILAAQRAVSRVPAIGAIFGERVWHPASPFPLRRRRRTLSNSSFSMADLNRFSDLRPSIGHYRLPIQLLISVLIHQTQTLVTPPVGVL